ncbi:MAG: ATP-dependent zinc metalloprotease FtsH [Firmicutes bacterium]|nr:ATP-dependent zinc metalloprotease FtsH [Bacillota bacterium]
MNKKSFAKVLYIIVIIAVIALLWSVISQGAQDNKELSSIDKLFEKIEAGEIYGVAMYNGGDVIMAVKSEKDFKDIGAKYDYYARFSGIEDDIKELAAKFADYKSQGKLQADFKYLPQPEPSLFATLLPYIIMFLLMGGLIFFMFQQMQAANGKAAQFGRATAKTYDGKNKTGFADVAGAEEEKAEMQELVDFLKNPKQFTDMGARVPKGVLLVGPPGTGKTLLAKAVAGEAGVPFYSITGSDFVELYVGIGASRVRDLFAQAKRSAPCIIFIDEIDAVGRRRGAGLGGGHDEREQTLNQLLVEMDGFNTNSGIIVLAATNRADILDPALLRSGRFDRQIHVLMPDVRGRQEIFKVHTRNKKLAADVNAEEIAQLTIGFTGADIENLVNEAALLAVRKKQKEITNQDIKDAITKVILGPEKRSHKYTEQSRKLTAYHEAGHAVSAFLLEGCDRVSEISIISRSGAGGYTLTRPDDERDYMGRQSMLDDICMGLSGRVAEELVMHEISSGASGDIRQVTKTAHAMVTEYGMYDDIGPIYLGDGNEVFIGRDFSAQKSFSDNWSARIDDAVHDIIQTQLERARKLLGQNMALLERVAQALLEREKLSGEEFLALTRGEELPPLSAKAPDADTAAADAAESDGNTPQEADGVAAGDNEPGRNTYNDTTAPDGSDKPQDRFF